MDKKTPKRKQQVFGRDAIRTIRFLTFCFFLLASAFLLTARFTQMISGDLTVALLVLEGILAVAAVFHIETSLIAL